MMTTYAVLAQSVERRSRKAEVAGSIPADGSPTLIREFQTCICEQKTNRLIADK